MNQEPCTVGLFGGSFNPPHYGHLAVSRACQKACRLDWVAWLITPQNPLKSPGIYRPLEERIKQVQTLTRDDPKIFVWDIEKTLQTTESVQTIVALQNAYPKAHFVWLMGADLLIELPLWPTWEAFVTKVPIVIYPRPNFTHKAKESIVVQKYASALLKPEAAPTMAYHTPPALLFLEGPEYDVSSTALRKEHHGL